ncbi:MAG: hypothetical protein FJ207_05400 [Gemmatimonadetes bacterium]|nr:hypothetical protein [Gemmatimonadota bacterium]
MAEPTETRQLSGLARSIDALFAPPSAPSEPVPAPTVITAAAVTVVTEVTDFSEVAEITDVPEAPEEQPAVLRSLANTVVTPPPLPATPQSAKPEMFPMSQMLEILPPASGPDVGGPDPAEWPSPAAGQSPEPEAMLEFGSSAVTEVSLEVTDAVTEVSLEAADVVPVAVDGDTVPGSDDGTAAAPVDEVRGAPEPRALEDAVRALVGGDYAASEQVVALATGLRQRLALDPLADAVEALVRGAGDPPDGRYLELAGRVIDPAVASRLVQRLGEESDEEKREGYLTLCRRAGLVMANALKGALTGALDQDVRRTYRLALVSMGEISRPVIERMVEDDNRFLVRDGVAMLAEIGGARATELVTSALADTDGRVRSEALLALGKLKEPGTGSLVLGFLEDPDDSVRLGAAVAAGELGLERALKPLLHMLEGEADPDRCVAILRALGQIGDPGAVQAIEKRAVPSRFSKPNAEVRVAAYRALHAIGTPHARDLVAKAVQDPVMRVALRDLERTGS